MKLLKTDGVKASKIGNCCCDLEQHESLNELLFLNKKWCSLRQFMVSMSTSQQLCRTILRLSFSSPLINCCVSLLLLNSFKLHIFLHYKILASEMLVFESGEIFRCQCSPAYICLVLLNRFVTARELRKKNSSLNACN